MDKDSAKRLVKKTLECSFNKEQFKILIKNVLNEFNEEKKFQPRGGQYISTAFKDSIKTLERVGQYKDSEDNTLDILIVQLKKDSTLERARSEQRNYIAKYLKKDRNHQLKDGALVAFVSPNQKDWRFSFVRMEYKFDEKKQKIKEEWTPARRYSFLVGENENSHTAQSCLVPLLQNDQTNPTLKDLENAFSVEKITKEFYEKYRQLFMNLTKELELILKKDQKIKKEFENKKINPSDFSKKLLGQIIFLYFLQKKGWFGVKKGEEWGTGSKKFLRELFEKKHGDYDNFFNDILEPLFYEALSLEHKNDYYSRFNCYIPFLNGGLFEPIKNYDWESINILLPNDLFSNEEKTKEGDTGNGILDIFDRYNFTVKEDEPLEKEVAVDPEMLGKVFENLLEVKDRKSKGTYYTPREIVHYMCQESLINYLFSVIPAQAGIQKQDIETLVRHGESAIESEEQTASQGKETQTYSYKIPSTIRTQAKTIDEKLKSIRICDPAVGSGAFPVGMMNEIVKARNVLTTYLKNKKERTAYHFKRQAIEQSLYGVDIDSGAIEIAKLRLWLSLVVDEEDREKIQPLPNLDYKMVCGNSLLSVQKDMFNEQKINEMEKLKPDYFNETSSRKKQNYTKQINQLIDEITRGCKTFDFEIYFSEVFKEKQGFDVVIANPPYVQLQKDKGKLANLYQSQDYETFEKMGDIYCLFYEKGFKIINTSGCLCFITSNKWMRANYGKSLRKYFFKNIFVNQLIDLGANIFDTATVDTNILILQKNNQKEKSKACLLNQKTTTSFQEYLDKNLIDFSISSEEAIWVVLNPKEKNIKQKIESIGMPLKEWNIKIYRGITIGYNKAFIIDNKTKEKLIKEDSKSAEILKPILRGKDINCYHVDWKNLWLITTHNGYNNLDPIDINKYKAIKNYLDQFYPQLEKRQDKGVTPYNLRSCAYQDSFEKEKIIYQEIVQKSSFSYDKNNFYCNDTARIITGENLKFLICIFNSKLFFYSVKYFYGGGALGKNGVRMKHTFFQNFPIPKIIEDKEKAFIKIVDKTLEITKSEDYLKNSSKQKQVAEYEKQIDQLVYKLYDLTPQEIKIIEESI